MRSREIALYVAIVSFFAITALPGLAGADAVCGNGVVEPPEQCDDGGLCVGGPNDGQPCPATYVSIYKPPGVDCGDGVCKQMDGDGCDSNCTWTRCGNGILTPSWGEECDDGNRIDGDGCDSHCRIECGNGRLDAGEECDDGGICAGGPNAGKPCPVSIPGGVVCETGFLCTPVGGDGCDAHCKWECGNGVLDPGEECEDGNRIDGDGCDSNCTVTRCGNGIVTAGEECDDGGICAGGPNAGKPCPASIPGGVACGTGFLCTPVSGDGCDANCKWECGNGRLDPGEECDDSNRIDGDGCDSNCTVTRCGNGIVTGTEECDDGNLIDGDGCDHLCRIEDCGDGRKEGLEECDDGNWIDGDGCDTNCTKTRCGNGIVTGNEECDDGGICAGGPNVGQPCPDSVPNGVDCGAGFKCTPVSGDGCDAQCRIEECGNGRVDAGEECDDGNLDDDDGCDSNCTWTRCGNAIVNAWEECDDGGICAGGPNVGQPCPVDVPNGVDCGAGFACTPVSGDGCDAHCRVEICGNLEVSDNEQCDDGNLSDGDGCDHNCKWECGNGVLDPNEECEDGNRISGDGCDINCTVTRCGNGVVTAGEECDDGNLIDGDGCDSNCTRTRCGNGIVTGTEECDDGNLIDGDGCDHLCRVEICGDGRVEGREQCDDGGTCIGGPNDGMKCPPPYVVGGVDCGTGVCTQIDGDGCESNCTITPKHDSVVKPPSPIKILIPLGQVIGTTTATVQVGNADVLGGTEKPGHVVKLVADDGDCPPGTVDGLPDLDPKTPGDQDSVLLKGGAYKNARVRITVLASDFPNLDWKIPQRCTLHFTVSAVWPRNVDPMPDNSTVPVELNVFSTANTGTDFFISSVKPLIAAIPANRGSVQKTVRLTVGTGKKAARSGTPLTVTASDGSCPAGTVGSVDLDSHTPGAQNSVTLGPGSSHLGKLTVTLSSSGFTTASRSSPARCTALLTVAGPSGSGTASHTTKLVIDVTDKNDF